MKTFNTTYSYVYCLMISLFFLQNSNLKAQNNPFDCDGSFYMSQRGDNNDDTELYIINVGSTINFNSVGTSSAYYNSVGYNVIDNFIYGIDPSDYQVYRIGKDGKANGIGVPSGLSIGTIGAGYLAGDVSLSGEYVIMGQVSADFIIKIDVSNSPPQVISMVEKKYADNNIQSIGASFSDIAFDPLTEVCYGFDQSTKRMATIDVETGLVDVFGVEMPNITGLYALFFNSFAQLFAYGITTNDSNARRFYLVNKRTGALTELTTGPPAKFVDGCACPYAIGFKKTLNKTTICAGQTVSYTFTFTNNAGIPIEDLIFRDELADALSFDGEPSDLLGGKISGNSVNGSNLLEIKNLTLPVGESSFSIGVKIPYNINQKVTIDNQATLDNLPEPYRELVYSDNPDTFIPNDATPLTILPPPEKINVTIGHNAPLCEGETLKLEATADLDELTFLWEGPNDFSSDNAAPTVVNVNELKAGDYTLTATLDNCWDTLLTTTVEVICLPKIIGLPSDTVLCNEETAVLAPDFEYVNSVQWQDGSDVPSYFVDSSGVYVITAENECGTTTDSVKVVYEDCVRNCKLLFPRAFSPNGDGKNDAFSPIANCGIAAYRLTIFDRWGQKVFETNEPQDAWTGEYGFEKQPIGTYVWMVECRLINDFEQEATYSEYGHIVLMR